VHPRALPAALVFSVFAGSTAAAAAAAAGPGPLLAARRRFPVWRGLFGLDGDSDSHQVAADARVGDNAEGPRADVRSRTQARQLRLQVQTCAALGDALNVVLQRAEPVQGGSPDFGPLALDDGVAACASDPSAFAAQLRAQRQLQQRTQNCSRQ
jgi:hypothetical protein